MSTLPEGWDTYDPNAHERTDDAAYRAARSVAAERAERRRAAFGAALAALRRARSMTQIALADQLGVAQGEVSRIEHQADLLLSTLARYVDGMDGEIALLVRYGDGETVELSLALEALGEEEPSPEPIVLPDLAKVIGLAGYLGRYDAKEEQFRALATA